MNASHRTMLAATAIAALAAVPAWAASESDTNSIPSFTTGPYVLIAQNAAPTVMVVPSISGPVAVVPGTTAPVAVVPSNAQVILAPTAPPPPQVEAIPSPPVTATSTQVVVWQAGHWNWSGANWNWVPGQYVARPQVGAVWVPGQWVQQVDGRYRWSPGHWS